MSHTEGMLTVNYSDILDNNLHPVFRVSERDSKEEKHENARRLVTCWNEHDGLVKERDELVATLRKFYAEVLEEFSYCPDPFGIDEILAKYPEKS